MACIPVVRSQGVKYGRKTASMGKLYQEEIIHIKFNENKIKFTSKQYYPSVKTLRKKN